MAKYIEIDGQRVRVVTAADLGCKNGKELAELCKGVEAPAWCEGPWHSPPPHPDNKSV